LYATTTVDFLFAVSLKCKYGGEKCNAQIFFGTCQNDDLH